MKKKNCKHYTNNEQTYRINVHVGNNGHVYISIVYDVLG